MSLDAFVFTPPDLDSLATTVESAGRAARKRFFQILTDYDRPSPSEFASLVHALRDLTAVHRTLRKMAGPLFDPASSLPIARRLELFERRLDRVQAALDLQATPNPAASTLPPAAVFTPPVIDDLVAAVDLATRCSALRFNTLDKPDRPYTTHPGFCLELQALRDLTAVTRTLHRMAGIPLAEDQSIDDILRDDAASGASDLSHASHFSRPSHLSTAPPPLNAPDSGANSTDPPESSSLSDLSDASDADAPDLSHASHFSHLSHLAPAPLVRPVPVVPSVEPRAAAHRRVPLGLPRSADPDPDDFNGHHNEDDDDGSVDDLPEPPYGNWTTPHAPATSPSNNASSAPPPSSTTTSTPPTSTPPDPCEQSDERSSDSSIARFHKSSMRSEWFAPPPLDNPHSGAGPRPRPADPPPDFPVELSPLDP
jgi:hypothetical protein